MAETSHSVYFMTISYKGRHVASAVGHVYAFEAVRRPGVVPVQVLATNDSLRVMWTSPAGSLWVASADGNVGTTASVRWSAPTDGTEYLTLGGSPSWSVTALPRVRGTGLPPNATALWGTGDDDVHVGTYGGHIYHWDGTAWTQAHEGPGNGQETIRALGGSGRRDVFATAAESRILHFDGAAWRPLAVPGASNGHETFTGVVARSSREVMICGSGDQSRLLHGSAAGLAEIGRYPLPLIDMAAVDARLLFATGNGVAELFAPDLRMIKNSFRTASMSTGIGRIFFIEPAQEGPRFIEYDPRRADAPWWRYTF